MILPRIGCVEVGNGFIHIVFTDVFSILLENSADSHVGCRLKQQGDLMSGSNKICILNPSDFITKYPMGGSSGFIENIMPYLGCPTEILGICFDGLKPWSKTFLNKETCFTPIGAIRYPSAFPLRLKAFVLYLMSRKRILERSGGLLYAHAPECTLPFLIFRGSVALVYHQHGSGNPLLKASYPWARKRLLIWMADQVQRFIHKRADWIIAIDRICHKQACQSGAGHKVTIIRNAVDNKMFCPRPELGARLKREIGIDDETKIILFAGRIEEIKRIDKLIDAMGILAGRNQKYCALIVGDGSLRLFLEDRVRKASLSNIIRFVGPVNHELLPAYYNAADLLALPSEMEGVPMVLLEAIACGTPVVASRVGGIPEFVVDGINGYCIKDTSPLNLCRFFEKAIYAKFDRAAVAASIAHLSAEKVASDLSSLFQRLMRNAN